ncbi:MAG: hypothetical protein AB8B63_10755 [Granulosicoccus sp.]
MAIEQDMMATTAVALGAVDAGDELLSALEGRSNILLMTQQAEEAVLRPADVGAWPSALRIVLAARIAAINELHDLARHYNEMDDSAEYRDLASPENDGHALGLSHVIAYMDNVAARPRDIRADDIRVLQENGVTDADIVRLTELNAFMAYQVRLISAVSLMSENDNG